MLSLTFGPRHELPRRMQREVAREGWEVVHPRAYPFLLVLNTPAGGLPEADAGDLVSALRAIGDLVDERGEELARGEAVTWNGPSGHRVVHEGGGAVIRTVGPWEPPEELAPGGAEGPGAEPEAALGQRENGLEDPGDLLAPADPFWDPETRDWQAELYDDLEARVMLPDPGLADGGEWGYASGPVEARLLDELSRRWLLWRDERIRSGLALPPVLSASLVERQRAWETTPRDDLDGRTPAEAVRSEQEARDDVPDFFDPS